MSVYKNDSDIDETFRRFYKLLEKNVYFFLEKINLQN